MTAEHDQLREATSRYLSGALPPAEARALEARFSADPALAEQLGLGLRLQRLYRLLEADRAPEPALPRWQERRVVLAGAAALGLALLALLVVGWRWGVASDRLAFAEARAARGLLDAVSATRSATIDPEAAAPRIRIGEAPTRVELRILVRSDRYPAFRATLERADGATAFVADRLQRDSGGHVGLAFNSALLPPDQYRVVLEGVTWRGDRVRLLRAPFELRRED